jgi:hypothetical protein
MDDAAPCGCRRLIAGGCPELKIETKADTPNSPMSRERVADVWTVAVVTAEDRENRPREADVAALARTVADGDKAKAPILAPNVAPAIACEVAPRVMAPIVWEREPDAGSEARPVIPKLPIDLEHDADAGTLPAPVRVKTPMDWENDADAPEPPVTVEVPVRAKSPMDLSRPAVGLSRSHERRISRPSAEDSAQPKCRRPSF